MNEKNLYFVVDTYEFLMGNRDDIRQIHNELCDFDAEFSKGRALANKIYSKVFARPTVDPAVKSYVFEAIEKAKCGAALLYALEYDDGSQTRPVELDGMNIAEIHAMYALYREENACQQLEFDETFCEPNYAGEVLYHRIMSEVTGENLSKCVLI